MKYKKMTQVIAGVLLVGAFISAPLVLSSNANAVECGILPQSICDDASKKPNNGEVKDTAIWQLLILVLNIMTAGITILAIGGFVYGAMLYTSSGDNQSQLVKAKEVIRNVVIGVVAFALMYSFLQWLIPGGVFN